MTHSTTDTNHKISNVHLAVLGNGLALNSCMQIAYTRAKIGMPISRMNPMHPMMANEIGAPAIRLAPNGDNCYRKPVPPAIRAKVTTTNIKATSNNGGSRMIPISMARNLRMKPTTPTNKSASFCRKLLGLSELI